ncbi:unnamed protein product [Lampetra fluviatilis]
MSSVTLPLLKEEEAGETQQSKDAGDRQKRLRVCVMSEILGTERDYVGALQFLVCAFLQRMRQCAAAKTDKHITDETIAVLFSNVEELLSVHRDFLSAIEKCLQPEPLPHHQLGGCFIHFKEKFRIYEEYCSNHEKALRLYLELNKIASVRAFFVGCMLLGGRRDNDIPLQGYLLSPIQRICKYPLLLKELLKRTAATHSDHGAVGEALCSMKAVCSAINETKRRMERLEALQEWQSSIEGWEGSSITDTCTEMLKQGSLLKISAGNIQERVFFLFDNLLVYCKRKSRNSGADALYVFRGRINTEVMEVENMEDGTADFHSSGHTVSNGWKIHNTAKNKWFVCMAKSPEEKQEWLDAILLERECRKSMRLGMERDTWMLVSEKGEKLYHMMSMQAGLVRDRKKKFATVPKCFLGSEFVSWLKDVGEISKREEGVNLGQALLENGIIHHVSDKHQFKDEPLFYRFRYDDGTFKPRNEMQDMISKGVRLYCRLHCLFSPIVKDKDYHLKTYKSVIMAYKLIDWLVSQGDCRTREEAVLLGVGLCNNGFMHHVLEKSEFKDDSLLFRFYADEDAEGLSGGMSRKLSRSVSLRVDFKVVENIIGKTLLIKPSKGGFGFEIEDKNNQAIVKSVERGSYAEMAGMRVGKKVYAVNGDPVFLRSFAEVEALLRESHHGRLHLRVLLATKPRETIKVSSCAEGLGFQIRGCGPSVVHAVGRGTAAAGAGLQPGQCIVKVNGSNVSKASHATVIAHVTAFRSQRQAPQVWATWDLGGEAPARQPPQQPQPPPTPPPKGAAVRDDAEEGERRGGPAASAAASASPSVGEGEGVSLTVDNTQLEYGVAYEFERTAGMRCHVLEKMSEPRGMFLLAAQVLEMLSAEDERLAGETSVAPAPPGRPRDSATTNAATSSSSSTSSSETSQLNKRIVAYKKFARTLRNKAWPTFKQAKPRTPSLHGSDFCPTNCHLNVLEVSYPRDSTVLGSSLGVRTERPKSRIDPDALAAAAAHLSGEGGEQAVGKLSPMVYVQHCVGTMGAPWGHSPSGAGPSAGDGPGSGGTTTTSSSSSRTPHGARDVGAPTRDAWTQLLAKIEGVMREIHRGSAQVQRWGLEGRGRDPGGLEVAAGGDGDGGKGDAERPRKVSFEVLKEEQEDSGHDTATSNRDSYSDCPSHRNSVMSLTSYCGSQRCSSLLSDDVDSGEESPDTLSLAMDRHERLQGCLEHLFAQVETLTKVMGGAVACSAFEKTKHLTPELTFQAFQQEVELSVSVADMIQLQVQHDLAKLSRNLHTIIHSVTRHASELKRQVTLALLDSTDIGQQTRRDTAFSQALVGAVCVFSEQLLSALTRTYNPGRDYESRGTEASRRWLEQTAGLGALVSFRSLLSPHLADERSMLEDTVTALQDLERVSFVFRHVEKELPVSNMPITYEVEGTRQGVRVAFCLEGSYFSMLPPRLQMGAAVRLHPVLFTQALERMDKLSPNEGPSSEDLQGHVNAASLEKVQRYYRSLRTFYLDMSKLPSDSSAKVAAVDKLLRPFSALDELIRLMEGLLAPWRSSTVEPSISPSCSSGVGLLPIAAEVCDRLGACHVLICNSGVHRCTLQVTLEQVAWLTRCHGLPPRTMMQATDVMRKQGARVQNTGKNLGVRDRTPLSVPRLYKLCLPGSDTD